MNFVIVSSAEQYQFRLGEQSVALKSPCLVTGTDQVWVITSKEPKTLQTMQFGFTSKRSDTLTDQLNQREPMLAIEEKMIYTT